MKIVALAVAAVCFIAAILYATGHAPGAGHHGHLKHTIAFVLLGILALVWMRMQNASAPTSA